MSKWKFPTVPGRAVPTPDRLIDVIDLTNKIMEDPRIRADAELLSAVSMGPEQAHLILDRGTENIEKFFDGLSLQTRQSVSGGGPFLHLEPPGQAVGSSFHRLKNATRVVAELYRNRTNSRFVAPEDVAKIEQARSEFAAIAKYLTKYDYARQGLRKGDISSAAMLTSAPDLTSVEKVPVSSVERYDPGRAMSFESIGNMASRPFPEGVTPRYRKVGNRYEPVDPREGNDPDPLAPSEYWRTGDVVWLSLKPLLLKGDVPAAAKRWKSMEYKYGLPKLAVHRSTDFPDKAEYARAVKSELAGAMLKHPYLSRHAFPETRRVREPTESYVLSEQLLNEPPRDVESTLDSLNTNQLEGVVVSAESGVPVESESSRAYLSFLQKAGDLDTAALVNLENYYSRKGVSRPLRDLDLLAKVYASMTLAGWSPPNMDLAVSVFSGSGYGEIFKASVGEFGEYQGRMYSESKKLGRRAGEKFSLITDADAGPPIPQVFVDVLAKASESHMPEARRRPPLLMEEGDTFDSDKFYQQLVADLEANRSRGNDPGDDRVNNWLFENADIFVPDGARKRGETDTEYSQRIMGYNDSSGKRVPGAIESVGSDDIATATIGAIRYGHMGKPVSEGFIDQFRVAKVVLDGVFEHFRRHPNYNPESVSYLESQGFVLPDWLAGHQLAKQGYEKPESFTARRQEVDDDLDVIADVFGFERPGKEKPQLDPDDPPKSYWQGVAEQKEQLPFHGVGQPLPGTPLSRPRATELPTWEPQRRVDVRSSFDPIYSNRYQEGLINLSRRLIFDTGRVTSTDPQAVRDLEALVKGYSDESGLSISEARQRVLRAIQDKKQKMSPIPQQQQRIMWTEERKRKTEEMANIGLTYEGKQIESPAKEFVRTKDEPPKAESPGRPLDAIERLPDLETILNLTAEAEGKVQSLKEKMRKSGKEAIKGALSKPAKEVTESIKQKRQESRKRARKQRKKNS